MTLELGRFLLDLAGAITVKGENARDQEALSNAIKILGFAEQESGKAHDWRTHARVLLDLSRRFLEWNKEHVENIEHARKYARLAKETVSKTGDTKLKRRIEDHLLDVTNSLTMFHDRLG